MEELIPILLQFVKSRQKPGGYVMWCAHNGFAFDLPFLIDLLGHTWFHPLMLQGWLVMETPWTLIEMGKEASGHTSETMEI